VLLDGSLHARAGRTGLLAALDRIPKGARVGFGVASDTPALLPLAPWDEARRAELVKLLDALSFEGGQDNTGALAEALGMLEGEPRATLLWIYGAQGFEFTEHGAELEQMLDRGTRVPEIWLLPVAPGPNALLRNPRLFAAAHTLAWSGDAGADIRTALDDYFDAAPRWTITRTSGPGAGLVAGSQHVEKLWALDQIEALLAQRKPDRDGAIALAARYRLVTPVSGAVVLESDDQYLRAGLTPPDPGVVPTIPEPETWALIIVACLAFAWALHARRRALA
jgi:hypothetical protein